MLTQKVAVVGCGASGLVAARELTKEGHTVVVFERGTQLGGTWVYTEDTETDPLGLDPSRSIVHSSLYDSLRSNCPRELMGFREFPFVTSDKPNRDSRRFPSHTEVLQYLEDYTRKFKLNDLIHYETEVTFVGVQKDGRWKVQSKRKGIDEMEESFDAVVICSGHYTEPAIADIPGIETWPGWQCHSHSYRSREPYSDQVVVVIGGSISSIDICREINGIVKELHVACRSKQGRRFVENLGYSNLFVHPMITRSYSDGRITFEDGTEVIADSILHCTGYKYRFPFLHAGEALNVESNRVEPLYKHVFPPALAPSLSFVGIPSFTTHFPMFELQSKWIAGVLSGRISLPCKQDMMKDIQDFFSEMEAKNVPKRHTYTLGDFTFKYEDWLAKECGAPPIEEWRKDLARKENLSLVTRPDIYRTEKQEYDEEHCELYRQAHHNFKQFVVNE